MQGRSLLLTNTQYLNTPAPDAKVTHGGAAGIIIGICLFPFMCICFAYAAWYAKKTAHEVSEPSVRKGKVAEEAPAAEEPAAASS